MSDQVWCWSDIIMSGEEKLGSANGNDAVVYTAHCSVFALLYCAIRANMEHGAGNNI